MASASWVLGVIRGLRGRAVLLLYLPPPEGESETRRRAQRLKRQPVRAGRRPPRSGALEEASTSPTLHHPSGVLPLRSSSRRGRQPPAGGQPSMPISKQAVNVGHQAPGIRPLLA